MRSLNVEAERPTGKTVSFNLSDNKHYNNQISKGEVPQLWYSPRDYTQFREKTDKIAKEMNHKHSYENVITKTFLSCEAARGREPVLTKREASHLIRCVNAYRLGMDRWCWDFLANRRSQRQKRAINSVLGMQHVARGNWDLVRQKSESITLPSRLFATTLGLALAENIQHKVNDKPAKPDAPESLSTSDILMSDIFPCVAVLAGMSMWVIALSLLH
jgi:hypothetical protein